MVRDMSPQVFVILYTLYIYPSAHKQLRRHIPNPFREFPYISDDSESKEAADGLDILDDIEVDLHKIGVSIIKV